MDEERTVNETETANDEQYHYCCGSCRLCEEMFIRHYNNCAFNNND